MQKYWIHNCVPQLRFVFLRFDRFVVVFRLILLKEEPTVERNTQEHTQPAPGGQRHKRPTMKQHTQTQQFLPVVVVVSLFLFCNFSDGKCRLCCAVVYTSPPALIFLFCPKQYVYIYIYIYILQLFLNVFELVSQHYAFLLLSLLNSCPLLSNPFFFFFFFKVLQSMALEGPTLQTCIPPGLQTTCSSKIQ